MGVILRESPDAGHPAQLPALLPTVNGPEFREPHREIAIAVVVTREDADVVRTVHRLQEKPLHRAGAQAIEQVGAALVLIGKTLHRLMVGDRRVLALLIVGEVPAGPVELQFPDVGSEHLLVALLVASYL